MRFTESSLFKSRFSQTASYLSALLKFKFLKLAIKLGILLAAIWFVSGTWLGDKLIPLLKSSTGGVYSIFHYVTISLKGLAIASLFIILAKIITGQTISKILFFLVGIGVLVLLVERFIF